VETVRPDEGPAEQEHAPEQLQWYQRTVPVVGLVVALVVLAFFLVPGFRHQVALSTSRQPDPFVELSFTDTRNGNQMLCTGSSAAATVHFSVTSHLENRQWLAFQVEVAPAGRPADAVRRTVRDLVSPGDTRAFTQRLPRPAGAYDVTVRLPELGQRLHARCGGAA
jgi:hypothetical protein